MTKTTKARIIKGDVVRYCQLHKALGLPLYSALLCDAPYALGSGKTGFMNLKWDSIDGAAFQPETWRAISDVLLPGAYLFCFAGNLNDDLISVAMRRAGLVKQHKSLAWSNGSSLPKTSRIDTRIDGSDATQEKRQREYKFTEWMRSTGITSRQIDDATDSNMGGHYLTAQSQPAIPTRDMFEMIRPLLSVDVPEWVEEYVTQRTIESETLKGRDVVGHESKSSSPFAGNHDGVWTDGASDDYDITAPATPLAQTWAGHRYGAQNLRNLVEAILIFRKPYEGKPYESIVKHGSGSLNIEGSRIAHGADENTDGVERRTHALGGTGWRFSKSQIGKELPLYNGAGRHPANFLIQHDARCVRVGEKRVRNVSGSVSGNEPSVPTGEHGIYRGGHERLPFERYADADGLETVSDFRCHESCVVRALDEQAGELKSGELKQPIAPATEGKVYGKYNARPLYQSDANTGGPSRFLFNADWQHEAFEAATRRIQDANAVRYQSKPSRAERDKGLDGFEARVPHAAYGEFKGTPEHATNMNGKQRNSHPTTKSISLMKYLAGLLLPPDAYAPRRLFCPFAGVASEMIGGMLAGWEEVVGVEIDTEREYIPIARARLAWWQTQSQFGQTDPAVILANAPPEANSDGDIQLDLFSSNGKVDG